MTVADSFAAVSIVVGLLGLVGIFWKLHLLLRLHTLEFTIKRFENTERLILKALDDERLLMVLEGEPIPDKRLQERYIQLWINHHNAVFESQRKGFFASDWKAFEDDAAAFFNQGIVKRHWAQISSYYSSAFTTFVEGLKTGAKLKAKPQKSA